MTKIKYSSTGLFWGIILIFLGIIFLLQNLLHIDILKHIWQFWPLILIACGIAIIVQRKD